MDQKRLFLYAALIALVLMIWQTWQQEHTTVASTAAAPIPAKNPDLPPVSTQPASPPETSVVPGAAPAQTSSGVSGQQSQNLKDNGYSSKKIVTVDTDVLHVGIDTQGGNLVSLNLLSYPESLQDPKKPVSLLSDTTGTLHTAQSGLISKTGPDNEDGQATYRVEKTAYKLEPEQNNLDVILSWKDKNGVVVNKIFRFQRGKYDISVRYDIQNQSKTPWTGQFYAQLKQQPVQASSGFFGLHTYSGGAISSPETPYEKISFSQFEKTNLDKTFQGGWLAMQQRYFLSAWIAGEGQQNRYFTRFDANNRMYTLGYVGPVINVPAGGTGTVSSKLYAGPESAEILPTIAPHLDLTIDYGWLWPISVAIFAVMKYIHKVIGNWGWSIVLVTLLIKLLFYKLSAASYASMSKMRKVTPQLQAIKERFGDDKQKVSQAMMELYKKEKINPLGGCLPMLIQIPFFIALYYVLIESVELRQAPFVLWIQDLSIRDPYFILPVLMGLSMFLQQRLNPPPTDPVQAKVMMFLPVVFTIFFVTFPAGLVLYWLVNNCAGVLQQWYIMRKHS